MKDLHIIYTNCISCNYKKAAEEDEDEMETLFMGDMEGVTQAGK